MTLALPIIIAVDDRLRGDCDGCGVTLPESELRDGPRLLLRRSYGYACASDYCWCPTCALRLWGDWSAMVRRRSTRGGRAQMRHVAEQLSFVAGVPSSACEHGAARGRDRSSREAA